MYKRITVAVEVFLRFEKIHLQESIAKEEQ